MVLLWAIGLSRHPCRADEDMGDSKAMMDMFPRGWWIVPVLAITFICLLCFVIGLFLGAWLI
jgi:hypothetical protein